MSHPLLAGHQRRVMYSRVSKPQLDHCQVDGAPFVVGFLSDPTTNYFIEYCRRLKRPLNIIDLGGAPDISGKVIAKILEAPGLYLRLTQPGASSNQSIIRHIAEMHSNVIAASRRSTNWSKPLHCSDIRSIAFPFRVPISRLVSRTSGSGWVLKPSSSQPAFVKTVRAGTQAADGTPLYEQVRVGGFEMRIHCMDDFIIGHRIKSRRLDYRTASALRCHEVKICTDWIAPIHRLTRGQGLRFSGIDIKVDVDEINLLEVNPLPGYHSYEQLGCPGTPISDAIYRALTETAHAKV